MRCFVPKPKEWPAKPKAILIFAVLVLTSGFQKDQGLKLFNNGAKCEIIWRVFTSIFLFAGRRAITVTFISPHPLPIKTN
jgi:hypothetical protein